MLDDISNPDEKVCEDITIVGSRLAVKRVCATRAQWAEKRRRDRDLLSDLCLERIWLCGAADER